MYMKKYTINDIDIYVNSWIPFKGFLAMLLYGVIMWRKEYEYYLNGVLSSFVKKTINHESIHKCQMKDFCPWLPIGGTIFYILYFIEWVLRLFINGPSKAYKMISFEQEAYNHQDDLNYIPNRKWCAQYREAKIFNRK